MEFLIKSNMGTNTMVEKELLDTSILILNVISLFIFMIMKESFGNHDSDYKTVFIASGVLAIILAIVYAQLLDGRPPSIATVAVLAQIILNMIFCHFLSINTTITVTTIPTVVAIVAHFICKS